MRMDSLSLPSKLSPQTTRLVMAIGWLLIGLGVVLMLMRVEIIVMAGSDFTHDYMASLALRTGRSIYTTFTQPDFSARALGMAQPLYRPQPVNNIHPPFDALLFLPLTLLPYNVAIALWSALSLLFYFLIGWIVLRELRIDLSGAWLALLIGLALCWFPFQAHIALGQVSLFLSAIIIGGWALLRRGRDFPAGVLIGLACLIKIFPGVIVLYLLLRRRWRAAGAALAVTALGLLVTLLVVGIDDVAHFFLHVPALATEENGYSLNNISLTGVIARVFIDGAWVQPLVVAPGFARLLTALCSLGLLALVAWQVWRMPRTQRADDIGFALACIVMLLISPITWQHIFPILVLPFGLLLRDLRAGLERRWLLLSLLALALISLPDINIGRALMQIYLPYRMPWYTALLMLSATIGLFLLWWLVVSRAHAVAVDDTVFPPSEK
jgi:hypothetical protein